MDRRRSSVDFNTENVTTMVLTPDMALEHIQPFFEHKWVKCCAQEIKISILKGGYCNSLWQVTRTNAEEGDLEPESVIVKKKGGNKVDVDEFNFSNDRLIALVAYEMAIHGLGPKIYGIFPGGSIEEYIQSHTLSPDEAADPDISRDIAIAMARSHAIQGLPLKKDSFKTMLDEYVTDYKNFLSKKDEVIKCEAYKKHNWNMEDFLAFDFEGEGKWSFDFVTSRKFRQNLILFDMNYLNVLVRDNPKPGQSRVMQIDYDIACYNIRGFDIGVHFLSKRLRWNASKKMIPDSSELSEDQKRYFLGIYQQEIKKLNLWPDFDETGIDSVDNLLLESKVGQMFDHLLCLGFFLSGFEDFGLLFGEMVPFSLQNYYKLKSEVTNNNSNN